MAKRRMASDYLSVDKTIKRSKKAREALWSPFSNFFAAIPKLARSIEKEYAATAKTNHGAIAASLKKFRGKTNDALSQAVNKQLALHTKTVEKLSAEYGGVTKIPQYFYANTLTKLQKGLTAAAQKYGGVNKRLVEQNAAVIGETADEVRKNGLRKAGKAARRMRDRGFESSMSADIIREEEILQQKLGGLRRKAREGKIQLSTKLQSEIAKIQRTARTEVAAAGTYQEKYEALQRAAESVKIAARRHAKSPQERRALAALGIEQRVEQVGEGIKARESYNRGVKFRDGLDRVTKGLGKTAYALGALYRVGEVGIAVWQKTNEIVNEFGRQQMAIQQERGGYGRMIRGAGINPAHMMTAIAAGRTAGMDDATVISQTVSLAQRLAQARWGEGGLPEQLGRWGGTPYNADGTTKNTDELYREMSRIFKSLGSEVEKTQFLTDMGIAPEQREMIENYEKIQKRHQRIRGNKRLQGVLESADILDESGFSARADAATKMELRRREILNQNAIDAGIWEATKRQFSPENWFFPDYTARQQGVARAKSEQAMEELTKELKELGGEVEKTGDKIAEGSLTGAGKETNLSVKQLKALSLSSGWAEASERNLGENSPVKILKQVLSSQTKGVRSDQQKALNMIGGRVLGQQGGMAAGALIGAAGGALAGGPIAPITALIGALIGGTAGFFFGGEYGAKLAENTKLLGDWSNEDIDEAKKAARGTQEEWENWKKTTGLTNLKRSTVLDADFDKEAMEGAVIQLAHAKAMEMTGGKEVDINQLGGDRFLPTMLADAKTPGEQIQRLAEALARTGDMQVARGEAILTLLKKGIKVTDPIVKDRVAELIKEFQKEGMGEGEAREAAGKQAIQEVITDAAKTGHLLEAQIAENRKERAEKYKEYQAAQIADSEFVDLADIVRKQYERARETNPELSFETWAREEREKGNKYLDKLDDMEMVGDREFDRTTGQAIIKRPQYLTQEEFERGYGLSTTEKGEHLRAYAQLEKQQVAGQIPFDQLSEFVKNYKIKESLRRKNFGGMKISGYSDELASLDDDALVAWLAMQHETSEDEIRNNILSREEYQGLVEKRSAGEKLAADTQARMRIYESSKAFKEEQEAHKKEEKKKNEDESAARDNLATMRAAVAMAGERTVGVGLQRGLARVVEQEGLSEKQRIRLEELRQNESKYSQEGRELSNVAKLEYADLERRERNEREGQVDRKKLIRIASARGMDLGANFSAEEIEAYRKEQEEEKRRFLAAGGSEGQYKLFQTLSEKELVGDALSGKETRFLEEGRKKLETEVAHTPTKLPGLHGEEESLRSQFGRLLKASEDRREALEAGSGDASVSRGGITIEGSKARRGGGKSSSSRARVLGRTMLEHNSGERSDRRARARLGRGREAAESILAPMAEKAAQAEQAAASGSAARSQAKGGDKGDTGKTLSVDKITVNQTYNFKDQDGTPEAIAAAGENGSKKGTSEAIAMAAASQNGF